MILCFFLKDKKNIIKMDKKVDYTLTGPGVVDKYKDAGVIA